MVKLRHAGYCNLKLLLLYLVVYGHWIENQIYQSEIVMFQYRLIYMVHMPLFVFLSGLFLRDEKGCVGQIRRLLPMYLVLQVAITLCGGNKAGIWTPYWHLWYLLSYCIWAATGWLWFRFGGRMGKEKRGAYRLRWTGIVILAGSILMGAAAGYVSWIGRPMSLSRTIVFFPYFFAGLLTDPKVPWQKYRGWGVLALGVAMAAIVGWGDHISAVFLYHAAPYGTMESGFALRMLCYGLGCLLGFFLLTFIPIRRFSCTRAGADTMPGYLLHAPLVGALRELELPWCLCAICSALLLYVIYKILQWNSPLYGIVPGERRDRRWLRFKKSTVNTASRCTDSFCP